MSTLNDSLQTILADSRSTLLIDKQRGIVFVADRFGNYRWVADANSLEEAKIICELNWPNLTYRIA